MTVAVAPEPDGTEPEALDRDAPTSMRGWAARWRLALRIARRDAQRHKARSVLILAMLMLPPLAGAFALTVVASSSPTTATLVALELGTGAQAKVTDALMEPDCELIQTSDACQMGCANQDGTAMPRMGAVDAPADAGAYGARLAAIAQTSNRPVILASQQASLFSGERARPYVFVLQGDVASVPGLATPASGRLPADTGEALLTAEAADTLHATLGSEVTVRTADNVQASARVVGIGTIGTFPWDKDAVLGPGTLPVQAVGWDAATYLVGNEPIGWDAVRRLNEAGFVALSRAVALDPPPDVPGPGGLSPEVPSEQTVTLTLGIAAIGLIEVLLIVGPAFAVGAKRQRRTLGLLAAAGAGPADLGRVVRATGFGFGAASGLLGAGLGVGAAWLIVSRGSWNGQPFPNFAAPWWWVVTLVPVTAVLGAAAAWLPGRSTARMHPVDALRQAPGAGSRSRARAWPGLVVTGLGLAAALVGSATGQGSAAMSGAVVVLLGVVLLAGPIISFVVRFAPRAGVAARLALRDADRHRARTASALAAVIACVAGGTLAVGFTAAADGAERSTDYPLVADGLITVAGDSSAPGDGKAALEARLAAIRAIAPMAAAHPVQVLADGRDALADVRVVCPGADDAGTDGPGLGTPEGDCAAVLGQFHASPWGDTRPLGQVGTIQDDGTLIGDTGLPGAAEAAAALRAGRVLTNLPSAIGPDGTITVSLSVRPADPQAVPKERRFALPAQLVAWQASDYNLVVPPDVTHRLGLTDYLSGYLLVPQAPLTSDQVARLDALSGEWSAGPQVAVTATEQPVTPLALLLFSGIALAIAAIATWIAVGLAAADARPDLASLAAIGASPGMRRRFAGAQAGVIALIGTVVGALVGLVALWVSVGLQRAQPQEPGTDWHVVLPVLPELALIVGVPLVAVLGAMAATRSRLPFVTRRIA